METTLVETDTIEDVLPDVTLDIPQRGDFVPCDGCQHRSYFFYCLNDDTKILSYCYHHGNKYNENLLKVATLVADYSDDLKENRLKGAP